MMKQKNNPPTHLESTGFCLLSISGSDAQHFLNNQLTIDVPEERGVFLSGAWSNAKGRIIISLEITRTGDDSFCMMIPRELVESVTKKLRLFILRARVTVTEVSTRFSLIHKTELGDAPNKEHVVIGTWLEGMLKGYCAIEGELNPSADLLHDYLIALGYPLILKPQSEKWIAQQLNMDRLDMIDFKKGCYPGQEVIARIYYKGLVKKRLQVIESKSAFDEESPNANERINATTNPINGTYYAQVISMVPSITCESRPD